MAQHNGIIVGLDLGTTKVAAVVGAARPDGRIDTVGVDPSAACGIKRGVVVHLSATVDANRAGWVLGNLYRKRPGIGGRCHRFVLAARQGKAHTDGAPVSFHMQPGNDAAFGSPDS